MPKNLQRVYGGGDLHFITFSCYQRHCLLADPGRRDLVLKVLEQVRKRYRFAVEGYVVMPEHVHLLISEPEVGTPSTVVQVLKQKVARFARPSHPSALRKDGAPMWPFWQPRFYDFNVYTKGKRIEKLRYMHRNPVTRALATKPEEWKWSSFRTYLLGERGMVKLG